MKTHKIYALGRGRAVGEIILYSVLGISSIIFFSLTFLHINYLIAGCVFLALTMLLVLLRLFSPCLLLFSDKDIKEMNMFKKVKKVKNWTDLKEIRVLRLYTGGRGIGDFFCLVYAEQMSLNNYEHVEDLMSDENLIFFAFSKTNSSILNQYTNIKVLTDRAYRIIRRGIKLINKRRTYGRNENDRGKQGEGLADSAVPVQ